MACLFLFSPTTLTAATDAQAGKLCLTLVQANRAVFEEAAAQLDACCAATADTLEFDAPIGDGLARLVELHRAAAELVRALRALPADLALTPENMAFHILSVSLITATTQVQWGGGLWRGLYSAQG